MAKPWTQEQAVFFCSLIEELCPPFGCHVALTGGCLYKTDTHGPRKDLDILFYRIRQSPKIDVDGLMERLGVIGVVQKRKVNNWLIKAEWHGRNIDIFFPEENTAVSIQHGQGYADDDED